MMLDPQLHDCTTQPELCVFSLTGSIQAGLPAFQPPPFSAPASKANLSHASHGNHGNHSQIEAEEMIPFSEMVATLGPAIVIIPLIAILESVAIAKAFAGGKPVDASQEMIALGLCNIFGSFCQSMPTT